MLKADFPRMGWAVRSMDGLQRLHWRRRVMQQAQEFSLPGRARFRKPVLQVVTNRWLANTGQVCCLHTAQALGKRQPHTQFAARAPVQPGEGLTRQAWHRNRILHEHGQRGSKRCKNAAPLEMWFFLATRSMDASHAPTGLQRGKPAHILQSKWVQQLLKKPAFAPIEMGHEKGADTADRRDTICSGHGALRIPAFQLLQKFRLISAYEKRVVVHLPQAMNAHFAGGACTPICNFSTSSRPVLRIECAAMDRANQVG